MRTCSSTNCILLWLAWWQCEKLLHKKGGIVVVKSASGGPVCFGSSSWVHSLLITKSTQNHLVVLSDGNKGIQLAVDFSYDRCTLYTFDHTVFAPSTQWTYFLGCYLPTEYAVYDILGDDKIN